MGERDRARHPKLPAMSLRTFAPLILLVALCAASRAASGPPVATRDGQTGAPGPSVGTSETPGDPPAVVAEPAADTAQEGFLLDAPDLRTLSPDALRERPGRFPFAVGERLEYGVSWWGIEVGRATIEVARLVGWRGLRLAQVVAVARTNPFFSLFYRVDDRSESWIDIDALRTVRTATLTRHAHKETWEEVEFDWRTHLIHVVEEKRHTAYIKEAVLDAGPFVYDTFDVLYALRSLPLTIGLSAELPVYASRKIYGLHIDVQRRERLRNPALGEVEALVIRPYNVLDGKPQDDGAGEVWVQADAPHVPLRMRGWFRTVSERLRVGGVRVNLVGYRAGEERGPRPAFVPRPAREWSARTEEGTPIWEVPEPVRAAREAAGEEPRRRGVKGVLSPLRRCRDAAASRGWARVALASTPCRPS